MRIKNLVLNSVIVLSSVVITCLIFEAVLRFVPVSTGISIPAVNAENPTFKAFPNKQIRFSRLWKCQDVRLKHINNAGFVNSQDYVATSAAPLLAIVGDSYVEAMQVPNQDAFPEVLQANAQNLRVYSFGFSGAPLSQYLIWAKHAQENYHNDYLIVNVVGNDFDESLAKYYKFIPGFHLYKPDQNGVLQLTRTDWQPKRIREFAKKSHLLSYMVRNLEVVTVKDRLKAKFSKTAPIEYVANTAALADPERVQDSYQAIDAFFRDLPQYSGLDAKHIMFVLDDRTTAYTEDPDPYMQRSYFHMMKSYFTDRAMELGYTCIDMSEPFTKHFQQHHNRFEFTYDQHWNSLGHAVVADTIMQSPWWNNMVQNIASEKSLG